MTRQRPVATSQLASNQLGLFWENGIGTLLPRNNEEWRGQDFLDGVGRKRTNSYNVVDSRPHSSNETQGQRVLLFKFRVGSLGVIKPPGLVFESHMLLGKKGLDKNATTAPENAEPSPENAELSTNDNAFLPTSSLAYMIAYTP